MRRMVGIVAVAVALSTATACEGLELPAGGATGSEVAIAQLDRSNPVRGDIEEILRAANSAASLTRQLLIFSRKSVAGENRFSHEGSIVAGNSTSCRRST